MRANAVALLAGLVPMLIFAAWIGLRRTGSLSDVLLGLGAVLLALTQAWYLGVAAVIAVPIVATAFDAAATRRDESHAVRRPYAAAAVAAFAVVGAIIASARGAQLLGNDAPSAAIDRLALDGRTHRLFCSAPTWCNYALLRDTRSIRVFIDGRTAAYPPNVRADFVQISRGQPLWGHTVSKWDIDTIVTSKGSLASLLLLLPEWKWQPAAGDVMVFERR
jgi:hypothetical protein